MNPDLFLWDDKEVQLLIIPLRFLVLVAPKQVLSVSHILIADLNHLGKPKNTLLDTIQKSILISRNVASPLVNPNWKYIDNGHTICKTPC